MSNVRMNAIRGLKPMPEKERYKYNITDLKVGGYMAFLNQNWQVIEINRYLDVKWKNFARRKSEEWVIELTILSLKTGEKHFIEFSVDDEIEICFTEKEVKLRELGLSRDEIAYIEDEEEGKVCYDRQTYYYSDDETWAGLYFHGDDKEGLRVKFHEFETNNGYYLTIESWYDDPNDDRPDRDAYISRAVKVSEIEILQL